MYLVMLLLCTQLSLVLVFSTSADDWNHLHTLQIYINLFSWLFYLPKADTQNCPEEQ